VRDSRESFANLSRWLEDARALASPHLVVVLVGNKSDREEDREVEWEEASRWAAEHSMCPCDGGGCFWLTYGRCPLPRDVLADGRQRGGALLTGCPIRAAIDRIWSAGSRESGERCELRRSRPAARKQFQSAQLWKFREHEWWAETGLVEVEVEGLDAGNRTTMLLMLHHSKHCWCVLRIYSLPSV